MRVDVWSDVVCPWCFIGKRRLEAALALFEHRDEVEVTWHAFELDPSGPPRREGDYVGRIARKYGVAPEQAQAMIDRMVRAGQADGLDFRFDIQQAGNTYHAHRLLHLAHAHGLQDALKERLFTATFTEGEAIGMRDVLHRLAVEVGLDANAVDDVLDSDRYGAEVREDEVAAAEMGVTGVPFFVFGGRLAVSGAQSPDVLLDVLEQAWAKQPRVNVVAAGEACDGDVCDV